VADGDDAVAAVPGLLLDVDHPLDVACKAANQSGKVSRLKKKGQVHVHSLSVSLSVSLPLSVSLCLSL
jgi:hypothetical protein